VLESTTDSINRTVEEVLELVAKTRCVDGAGAEVEIALREALANAVFHGNRGDPDRKVLVRVYGDPGCGMVMAVRDEGPGFEPSEVPDPRSEERVHLTHGRGIFLMQALMDRVEYRRRGTEVWLVKHPTPRGLRAAKRRPPK
jgi:serine/threonine-protein kinase RsbW